jgi:hypothetical protein
VPSRAKRDSTFPQSFTSFLIDLGAAVRWVFNRRRFAFGFTVGWCCALLFGTLYVLAVLEHQRLLGYCINDFLRIFGRGFHSCN